jgi:hypothetical protein
VQQRRPFSFFTPPRLIRRYHSLPRRHATQRLCGARKDALQSSVRAAVRARGVPMIAATLMPLITLMATPFHAIDAAAVYFARYFRCCR